MLRLTSSPWTKASAVFERTASSVIVLVGMMGAGKTTVGKVLGDLLDVPFVDNDDVVSERGGALFAAQLRDDATKARQLESDCVQELLVKKEPMVLSLGGGAPVTPSIEQILLKHAPVVWIQVPEDELYRRIEHEAANRPMLDGDPYARLRELLALRIPVYKRVASVTVDGVGSPREVAERIAGALK